MAGGPTGRRRFTLGSYPQVGLAQARGLAEAARNKHQAAAIESAQSLAGLVERYGAVEGPRLRSWATQAGMMKQVFGGLWSAPCRDLTVAKIQRIIDSYPARVMAARAATYFRTMLKWGRRRGYVDFVAAEIETPKGTIRRRERVLSRDELVRVVGYLRDNLDNSHYRVMWLLLLTACRLNEVAEASWEDVEFGADPVLRVPKERSKNKAALTIPLTPQAVEALGTPGKGRIFPAANNWTRYQLRIMAATETSGWHRHDLRRTTATVAGELGYAPHVIDAMLGHIHLGSSTHTNYNLSRYLPEQRQALQTIADYYSNLT